MERETWLVEKRRPRRDLIAKAFYRGWDIPQIARARGVDIVYVEEAIRWWRRRHFANGKEAT